MIHECSRIDFKRFRAFGGLKAPHLCRVMLDRDRPEANVFARLPVCVLLVTTLLATEAKSFSVGRRDVSTYRTTSGCVPWAYDLRLDSNSSRLILDLESGIGIRPSVYFRPKVFALTQRTVSNVREVFKDYSPGIVVNRVLNQGFRSTVQQHVGYGSLVSRHSLKKSSGTSGANRLNLCASATNTGAAVIEMAALEEKSLGVVGVSSDEHPLDAHVYANYTPSFLWFLNFNFVSQTKIPLSINEFDLGIFPTTTWEWSGIVSRQQFSPQSHAFFGSVEIAFPNYRQHVFGEFRQFPTLVAFGRAIGRADDLTGRTRELRREPHLPQIGVVGGRQSVGIEFLGFENDGRKPVNGFEPDTKKCVGLTTARNFDLDCSNSFHYIAYYQATKTMSIELRKNRYSVSKLLVHLVFVVKYRHAIISDAVWKSLSYGFDISARRIGVKIIECNYDKDYVHVVIEYPPKISVSEIANALKGYSSFVARRDCKEELRKKLWGGAFWSPSFFAASCGGAPIEVLKLYVQTQQAALKGGVSTQEF